MVTYIEYGDIFALDGVNNYAHGCNCAGRMGAGIAVQFKAKFPVMYDEYKKLCDDGTYRLGDVFAYDYGNGCVFNLGTQENTRTKATLEAVEQSLKKMLSLASTKNINKIALPRIGAGLGGLNWDDVRNSIDKVALEYPEVELIVVENYKPAE